MATYILLYWIIAFVFECAYLYFMYKEAKSKLMSNQTFQMFKSIFMSSPNMRIIYDRVTSPLIMLIGVILLFEFSGLLFPISLFSIIKKATGYKTRLEKEAEEETRKIEQARKASEEFMKNEGDMGVQSIPFAGIEINLDDDIEPESDKETNKTE